VAMCAHFRGAHRDPVVVEPPRLRNPIHRCRWVPGAPSRSKKWPPSASTCCSTNLPP
jgi:hypothetical protein